MEKIKFTTISQNRDIETEKVRGSRFIGTAVEVISPDSAEKELEIIRKKYYNATHNCFAYITGSGSEKISRYSDDGEPSGTAGRPIMNVLEGSGLTNVLVVVTRYYGGTKLGTGGLVKAYGEAASAAIEASGTRDVETREDIRFTYKYDHTSLVMNIISKYEGSITGEVYGDSAEITVSLNTGYTESFISEILERSNGMIRARK